MGCRGGNDVPRTKSYKFEDSLDSSQKGGLVVACQGRSAGELPSVFTQVSTIIEKTNSDAGNVYDKALMSDKNFYDKAATHVAKQHRPGYSNR